MSSGTGLGTGLQTAGDAESLLGLSSAGSGSATPTDWAKISKMLEVGSKAFGGGQAQNASDASYLRTRAQDAPVESGTPSSASLLLTLLQMHRNAMASQQQQQPRTSLLG